MVEIDSTVNDLSAVLGTSQKPVDDSDEFVDEAEEMGDALSAASDLLKRTAILLEFLSDPVFCKGITKRERGAISRHLDQIYKATDDLDQIAEELSPEDDDKE